LGSGKAKDDEEDATAGDAACELDAEPDGDDSSKCDENIAKEEIPPCPCDDSSEQSAHEQQQPAVDDSQPISDQGFNIKYYM